LWFAVCGLRFAVCGLWFAVCGLRFAVCGSDKTLFNLHDESWDIYSDNQRQAYYEGQNSVRQGIFIGQLSAARKRI
jgi:hypothetical protein